MKIDFVTKRFLIFTAAFLINLIILYKVFEGRFPRIATLKNTIVANVSAEDEEESEEEHKEENREVPLENTVPTETPTALVEVVPAPKVTYVWVTDAGYDVDTDKDGLVDAIDPDPQIPQIKYFTDTDSDGIPDALDQYPGEKDYSVFEDQDANHNGVLDSYE